MDRAEWGPLPTSLLPTAEYPKRKYLKGWPTVASVSFRFLNLFPCDYSRLSAEPTDIAANLQALALLT